MSAYTELDNLLYLSSSSLFHYSGTGIHVHELRTLEILLLDFQYGGTIFNKCSELIAHGPYIIVLQST